MTKSLALCVRRIVATLVCWHVLIHPSPSSGQSATAKPPRCAYVDVGLLPGYSEPRQHCFRLDFNCPATGKYGCFKVPLTFADGWVEQPGQPRRRRLAQPFGYVDPEGIHWDVPAGTVTDGASIPLFFQALIGGPWTEGYVKAATLHDFYIRRRSANADAVHHMFYLALIADGVSQSRAALMFEAVKRFGPQWKSVDVTRVQATWEQRKAAMAELTRLHQQMWEAFQASERRQAEQAAIDRATFAKPLKERSRHVYLHSEATAWADLARFIDAALAAHIINRERDATLIQSIEERLAMQLRRPATERDNVFVLRFLSIGAQFGYFRIASVAELEAALALDAQISEQMDRAFIQDTPRR